MDINQKITILSDEKAALSQKDADKHIRRETCYTCWRKKSLCFCEHIKPFPTQTEFVLLMHPKEAKKQKLGTGRLSHAALINSQIITDVNLDHNQQMKDLLADPTRHVMLMYPAADAVSIDESEEYPTVLQREIIDKKKKLTLLLLDATWPCAKKMMKLSTCLHHLPKVSFTQTYKGRFLIKHQPNENCLSTLETIYHSIQGLKRMGHEKELINQDPPLENNLLELMDKMIAFQIKCATDPNIPSSRGTKSKVRPTQVRVRAKRHRLFYYDLEKSPVGDK
ncbi:MAG: DTW domain-containing protein [Halobacteriovoraceae bacterium]|nr:DTW domain-containing protein [Halobacteriovoraceae bacterium]|tara:strand:+ start:93302 stop:94141 length:840 start_codon:yes stop_codon:yes gene_type:complete